MGDAAEVVELRDAYLKQIDAIIEQAKAAPVGGGGAWGEVLLAHGIEPIARKSAEVAIACGFQPTQGALPIEVRKVCGVIQGQFDDKTQALISSLQASEAPDNVVHQLSKLDRELRKLTDDRVSAYVDSIRPKSTLGGIFANAAATSLQFGAEKGGAETLRCKCCGAARPADTDLRECAFCGNPLFDD